MFKAAIIAVMLIAVIEYPPDQRKWAGPAAIQKFVSFVLDANTLIKETVAAEDATAVPTPTPVA